ncbi:transposase [Actinoallomurus acaciae]|uniref:Transposase n=1 Tax=Actinoallomurus acaciae TaxID=502577 RepID=A0ABV5Y8N0_9ACTN
MKTDLDALLIALYVHLDDYVPPTRRRGPGRPRLLTDTELICIAIAQVLLRCDDERRWLRVAPARIGHLFPRLPSQSGYNRHLRALGPLMSQAAPGLARQIPTWHDRLRLMDGTPIRCGASRVTVDRSLLGEIAAYGRDICHHAFYRGAKLMLTTTEGTVTAFSLANPKEPGRTQTSLPPAACAPHRRRPRPMVCDKGFAGAGIEKAAADLGHLLIRPQREDEPTPAVKVFPSRLHQRIEAIIWTLKNQLGLERHNARTTDSLWARISQRILALNTAI